MKKIKQKDKLITKTMIFIPVAVLFVCSVLCVVDQRLTSHRLFVAVLCAAILLSILLFEILSKRRVDQSLQKIKENELKLYLFSLQSQMDLHFWNNMLGMISLEAQLKNNNKITKVCGELSKMLSFTSSLGDGFCTLEEELCHVQNYLEIMKMRYEDYFEYQINVTEDMKQLRIPKYILQPICENAFLYAFKGKESVWKIHIECKRKNKQWFIIISDNGIGFDEASLDQVRSMLENITIDNAMLQMETLSFGGLSFPNVYLRLLLTYYDQSVFEVKNTERGASITLGGEIRE